MNTTRKSYPSDVSDAEWTFLVPYLTLMREDATQREYPMRDLFNAMRYVVKTGCTWRFLPHDFPPWTAVYQQARRWLSAGVFETIAHELRILVRLFADKQPAPFQFGLLPKMASNTSRFCLAGTSKNRTLLKRSINSSSFFGRVHWHQPTVICNVPTCLQFSRTRRMADTHVRCNRGSTWLTSSKN